MAAAESCDLGSEADISLRNFASYFATFAVVLIVLPPKDARDRKEPQSWVTISDF